MRKRTTVVFPSRFFWPPWSAVAKWLQIFIFLIHFPTAVWILLGVKYIVGNKISGAFRQVYYKPQIPEVSNGKLKKTNMELFSNCRSWWSKELQWKTTTVLFCDVLYLCTLLLHLPNHPKLERVESHLFPYCAHDLYLINMLMILLSTHLSFRGY